MGHTRMLILTLMLAVSTTFAGFPDATPPNRIRDSGGPLTREQAAYDVLFYRLAVTIDTLNRTIAGTNLIRAQALDTLSTLVVDLNAVYTVSAAVWKGHSGFNAPLSFVRDAGKIRIALPHTMQKAETIFVEVAYSGKPKVAVNPPWDDGFVWKRTKTGELWAGVACEEEGGDIWWPCKDHPSDEPDSVDLNFTVPSGLVCVSNGRLRDLTDGGTVKTYRWYLSQPVSTYCVTFYLGPFQKVPVDYTSVTGETIPSEYWFLPYNVDSVTTLKPTWLKDLRFLEETCGPFPFRAEKYCIVDAPYAGMEHQTAVAYGKYGSYHFNPNFAGYGFDYIHLHELAHEWWGNLVTGKDWSDVWIHEGFATYMEALFVEKQSGAARYRQYMARMKPDVVLRPLAPDQSITAQTAFLADVYYAGAWVLHTLRWYLGDQAFFPLLRRWAYPDPAMETVTDGRQCRLATVAEFLKIAEDQTGKELDWFFSVYLRQTGLPQLLVARKDTTVTLTWSVPNGIPFPMPVEVQVSGKRSTVDMSSGTGTFTAPVGITPLIDPDAWISMADPTPVSVEDPAPGVPGSFAVSVYPNPFNPSTTLRIDLPERTLLSGEIVSVAGERVADLEGGWRDAGTHTVTIDLQGRSSGVYFVVVRGGGKAITRKMMLIR